MVFVGTNFCRTLCFKVTGVLVLTQNVIMASKWVGMVIVKNGDSYNYHNGTELHVCLFVCGYFLSCKGM